MSRRLLLRLLASAPAADHVADAELLHRFAASADAAAFELLVRRHADAVWATCRRMLGSDADAEDAFQATFLALIRKAKSIRTPSAGGWLHQVAVNAALKLRERAGRVPSVEPQQLDATPAAPSESPDADLAVAVHEELARLPDRERLPVVLCDLEGLSHGDAAKALGWPVGTVSGRLSRARAKLRDRLERRGLAPASVLVPVLTAPPHLVSGSLSLITGAVPPAIVFLTEGALAMLKTNTWTWGVVAVACAGLVGTGAAVGLTRPGGNQQQSAVVASAPVPARDKAADAKWVGNAPPSAFPDLGVPEPAADDPNAREKYMTGFEKKCPRLTGTITVTVEATDDTLRKLLKARLHQGVLELEKLKQRTDTAGPALDDSTRAFNCIADMQATAVELWAKQPKELTPWLEELLIAAKVFERYARLRVEVGALAPHDLSLATRHRLKLEAELWKVRNAK